MVKQEPCKTIIENIVESNNIHSTESIDDEMHQALEDKCTNSMNVFDCLLQTNKSTKAKQKKNLEDIIREEIMKSKARNKHQQSKGAELGPGEIKARQTKMMLFSSYYFHIIFQKW